MPGTASPAARRLAFALIAGSLALWVLLRLVYGIGWGALDRLDGAEQIPLGIAHGIEDNLSYVTWAEEARNGLLPFTVLHTTEPHPAIFVAPLFVAVGGLAALFDVHPLLVLNLAALAGGVLALFFVFRLALAMGLAGRGALLALLFTAYGSGLSAVTLLLSGGADWAQGADATYLDLLPSAILPFFPYQCLALAALLALLWVLLRAEQHLARGAPVWPVLAGVFALALLAIAIRPYAPVSLLAVYAVLAVLTWPRGAPALRRARALLLLALAAGIVPPALYDHWVASQPVWSDFAAASLDLPHSRLAWLIGFGVFWPLAAAGAALGLKRGGRGFDLVALWAGLVVVLLLVADVDASKLADGGFVALALLAAHAVDRSIARLSALTRLWRLLVLELLGLVLLAAGLSTLALYGHGRGPDYYPLDREIALAAREIRAVQPRGVPTVLTEYAAGALLPPLAGLRVYAGHWSLTVDPVRKLKLLIAAGFEPGSPRDGGETERRNAYSRILAEARFDWVLVRKDRPVLPLLLDDPWLRPAYQGKRWLLFRVTRP